MMTWIIGHILAIGIDISLGLRIIGGSGSVLLVLLKEKPLMIMAMINIMMMRMAVRNNHGMFVRVGMRFT